MDVSSPLDTCPPGATPGGAGAPARVCPALLVAAPASGQGKTTVVAALARLLVRRGVRVRVFKCGPDFLDPFWHELASGHPVHQIDLWMTGEADIRARLHAAAGEADVLLVEGVMGLHDGAPSAAALARRLGLPVLAVIGAGAMAQTFGALAHGLRHYRAEADGALPWAGVLANHVGSEGHAQTLRAALDEPGHWLGRLPRDPALALPERHLGLVAAHELAHSDALARLDAAADHLAATPLGQMSLDDWRERWAVHLLPAPPGAAAMPGQPLAGKTVAVARDAAFAFIYPANVHTLRALGAQVVFFSPLAGEYLPTCDALWLPGGYPELHAAALSERASLRTQLHAHAAAGKPIWAECGGMMALFDELVDADGQRHAMWALLPGRVNMQRKLARLGPQQWAPDEATPALRGHTFHYSTCQTPLAPLAHTAPPPGRMGSGEAVYAAGPHGAVRASYFHAWFASSPAATAWLFGAPPPDTAATGAGHD